MPEYTVRFNYQGDTSFRVDAANEDEAIIKAEELFELEPLDPQQVYSYSMKVEPILGIARFACGLQLEDEFDSEQ